MENLQGYFYPCKPGVLVQRPMLRAKQQQYLKETRGRNEKEKY
jgi:hypothetical protein